MERDNPTERPRWLGALLVTFGTVGALMAATGEGGDRIWGLVCVAFFGGCGLVLLGPRRASRPGVFVERAEHRGGRWGLSLPLDRRRYVLRIAAAWMMAFAGLLMAVFAEELQATSSRSQSPAVLRVIGVGVAATFGGFGALGIAYMRTTPRMLLLEEGIEFEAQGGRTFVPWDAITWVGVVSLYRNQMIGVTVDDRQRIETGPVSRSFLRFNRNVAGADVTFPLDALVASPQVVVDAVRRFAGDPEERRRLGSGRVSVAELEHAGIGPGGPADG